MKEKFTIKDFNAKYPDDNACLEKFYKERYGETKACPACKKAFKFYKVASRKCWECQYCSHQIHPLAGTIFHKSDTSLRSWFFAIFLFSHSRNGVSGKELQRQLGVTYKTAWRMAKQIRKLFSQKKGAPLSGTVEIDETLIGGKKKGDEGGHQKASVVGAVERGAEIRAQAIPARYISTVLPFVRKNVNLTATVYTDQWAGYKHLPKSGYHHESINHSRKQYALGMLHTNTIEGFWSQLKRGIDGSYHHVSPKYLQAYVDEFAFRYNARFSSEPLFSSMVQLAARPD